MSPTSCLALAACALHSVTHFASCFLRLSLASEKMVKILSSPISSNARPFSSRDDTATENSAKPYLVSHLDSRLTSHFWTILAGGMRTEVDIFASLSESHERSRRECWENVSELSCVHLPMGVSRHRNTRERLARMLSQRAEVNRTYSWSDRLLRCSWFRFLT
uniref:Putative secreted protein n=1 Tax=Ixodes ricinus TaxID=34613 RepID=A0A6B0UXK7_IXORI